MQATRNVYVVIAVEHVDCYKGADSSGDVVGVFDSENKAVCAALDNPRLRHQFTDDDIEYEDIHLRDYHNYGIIPELESDRKVLFEKVIELQDKQEGVYTVRASGYYFKIAEMEVE
jgi:hypothetical protein